MEQGRFRLEGRLGNMEADTAADLSRRHQTEVVMDVRRSLLSARKLWCPVVLRHRSVVAVSVNHDGRCGSALDPLV